MNVLGESNPLGLGSSRGSTKKASAIADAFALPLGLEIGRIEDATLSQSKATERTLVISPLEGK